MWQCTVIVAFIAIMAAVNFPILLLEEFTVEDALYEEIAMPRGQFLNLRGVPVHYIVEGPEDGEAVVVLHGISGTAQSMKSLTGPLAKAGYRVISFDFFGRGHSGNPLIGDHDHLFFANQTAEVVSAVEKVGAVSKKQMEKFHLVALSMGGSVGVVYASQFPERIKTLTLLAPAGLTFATPKTANFVLLPGVRYLLGSTSLGRYLLDIRIPGAFVNPATSQGFMRECQMTNHFHMRRPNEFIRAFLSTLAHFPLTNTTEEYKKVGKEKFPVIFIWGTEDKTVPMSCMKEAKELVPRAEFVTLNETGHMAHMEKKNEVLDPIFKMLKYGTSKAPSK